MLVISILTVFEQLTEVWLFFKVLETEVGTRKSKNRLKFRHLKGCYETLWSNDQYLKVLEILDENHQLLITDWLVVIRMLPFKDLVQPFP